MRVGEVRVEGGWGVGGVGCGCVWGRGAVGGLWRCVWGGGGRIGVGGWVEGREGGREEGISVIGVAAKLSKVALLLCENVHSAPTC